MSSTFRPRWSASEIVRPQRSGSSNVGARNTGLQPFPFDQTLGERPLARQAPGATSGFRYELGNLARADGDGLRDSAPVVEEVSDGRAHPRKSLDGLAVGLKKHRAVETVRLHERTVALGTAIADEDKLRLPSPEIHLKAGEVGGDLAAEPALRTPVDEEDTRLEVVEFNLLALEIRQPKRRERGRERETSPRRVGPGGLEGCGWSLESLDSEQQPSLLPDHLYQEPRKRHHSKEENSEEHPQHDGHTKTPPPQVQAIVRNDSK